MGRRSNVPYVICTQLGYEAGQQIFRDGIHSPEVTWSSLLECTGSETRLGSCARGVWTHVICTKQLFVRCCKLLFENSKRIYV